MNLWVIFTPFWLDSVYFVWLYPVIMPVWKPIWPSSKIRYWTYNNTYNNTNTITNNNNNNEIYLLSRMKFVLDLKKPQYKIKMNRVCMGIYYGCFALLLKCILQYTATSQNITNTTTFQMLTRYITNKVFRWRPFWISKWSLLHIDCNVIVMHEAVYTTYSQTIVKTTRIHR
jgi:hypothetical protein